MGQLSEKKSTNSSGFVQTLANFRCAGIPMGIASSWVDPLDDTAHRYRLTVPYACDTEAIASALAADEALGQLQWEVTQKIAKLPNSQPELPMVTGNVIVVSSGKGGVGKSSVSVSLALALQQLGANVGLLDADIYGPSIPTMLGRGDHKLEVNDRNKMVPVERFGVQVNSLGYLVDEDDATIWRGPMASGVLQQLYSDTDWQQLDYLIVDMPPGTGDIQLTMAQKLPITAALVVTTPQTVALKDAEKGIAMFNKLSIPMLGVLENMSFYQCSECGHKDAIFGRDGGAKLAQQQQVELIAQWPLTTQLRESLDKEQPLLTAEPQHELSQLMRETAQTIAAKVYHQGKKTV